MNVVCLGELLMRLDSPGHERLVQSENFHVRYTGAEANAAVSLSNYGQNAWAVSAVPDNEIGQACVNYIRRYGVNTEFITRKKGRLGIFFLETGAAQRPSKVMYDRADSVMANATAEDFDFEKIFSGKDWLHFSGTLPALGNKSTALTESALRTAKNMGLTISCDLNYRKKLWSSERAQDVMNSLMPYVDVLIGNEEDSATALGLAPQGVDVTQSEYSYEPYRELTERIYTKFEMKYVAMTFRKNLSASVNKWSAGLYDGNEFHISREYTMQVVDRVGGGDSFSGGLIYALLSKMSPQKAIEFAVCASCLKHSIPGDFNLVSYDEVMNLVNGEASGRVQR